MEIEAVGFGNVVSQPLRKQGADAVGQREREIDGVAQRLTDEDLEILFSLARPIAQEARQGFLAVVRGDPCQRWTARARRSLAGRSIGSERFPPQCEAGGRDGRNPTVLTKSNEPANLRRVVTPGVTPG